MATENTNSGNQSTSGTGTNPLAGSPWGRLTEVTSLDNVTQGFVSATGGNTRGNAPMSGGGTAATTNPFSNFGNPNAEGSPLTGGVNPWAAINTSGSGSAATSTTSTEVSTDSLNGTTSTGGSTDVITGAPTAGTSTSGGGNFSGSTSGGGNFSGSTSGGGSFGGSTSGGGNFGGIDFGSASSALSFQYRFGIDQLISAGPTDESVQALSSRITDSVVNQVSLGSTSSVGGAGGTELTSGENLFAGGDNSLVGGSNQNTGDSIPFA